MFRYTSIQTHSEFKKGKRKIKTQRVVIKNNSGYKMVTIRNKGTKKSKKKLNAKEIACIKKCEFIPKLFKDCEKCLK